MSRTQLILTGTLALQLLLILIFRSPFSGASGPSEPLPLVPELAAQSPARIELAGSEEDEHVSLVRAGDRWSIEELDGFPADGDKVDEMLETLEGLEVRRPVVTSKRYHDSFKVTETTNEGRVRIFDEGASDPGVDLILGSSANYRTTLIRRVGDDRVFEVRGLSAWEVRPDSDAWIRKELVEASESDVTRVTVRNRAGVVELERDEAGWQLGAGDTQTTLDLERVNELVRFAADLRLAQAIASPDPAATGLDDPDATVTLETSDGPITVEFGRLVEDDDGQRYVRLVDSAIAGRIWESSAKRFVELDVTKLSGS